MWALGVILYQGLTGELPFQGESWLELAGAIARAAPTAPRKLAPATSPDLEAICLRALAPEPAERFLDGAELAAELRAFLAGQGTRSRTGALLWRRVRTSRARLLAAPILALVTLGAVATGYRRTESSASSRAPTSPSQPGPSQPGPSQPALPPPSSSPTPGGSARGPDELPDLRMPALEDEPLSKTSMRTFVESAIKGETYAMLTLAACYDSGAAGITDGERALAWYLRAAEQGNTAAKLAAAFRMIEHPVGRAKRTRAPAKALELLQQAYEEGAADAGLLLGQVYRYGALGCERDRERAHQLFRAQIEKGDAVAAVRLAEDLAEDDPAAARRVLEEGRDRGFPDCSYGLARMAWWGEGGPQDRELALTLLRELTQGDHDYYRRQAERALARHAAGRPPLKRR